MSSDEAKVLLEKIYLKNTEVIGAYSNKPATCLGDVFASDSDGDCFTEAKSEDGVTVSRYMYYQGKFSTITKFSGKIAVETPTQEQFYFVRTWSGNQCSFSSSVWEKYKADTVIVPSRGQYGMKEEDGLVYITFDEFLLVTNQTFESSTKPVEQTSACPFKIGDKVKRKTGTRKGVVDGVPGDAVYDAKHFAVSEQGITFKSCDGRGWAYWRDYVLDTTETVDSFALPKHWKVEITDENRTVLDKFKKSLGREDCRQYIFVCNEGFGWHEPKAHYIAITYEQFLQYVIKMSPDEYLGMEKPQLESTKPVTSIPEKYGVKITDESREVLFEYWKTKVSPAILEEFGHSCDFCGWFISDGWVDNTYLSYCTDLAVTYTELSFETFRTLVYSTTIKEPMKKTINDVYKVGGWVRALTNGGFIGRIVIPGNYYKVTSILDEDRIKISDEDSFDRLMVTEFRQGKAEVEWVGMDKPETESFVLPKKWVVALTQRVYDHVKCYADVIGYHHSERIDSNNWASYIKSGFTEITEEQYFKYVVGETPVTPSEAFIPSYDYDFVLPKKWCIRQNASQKACDWFRKNGVSSANVTSAFTYLCYNGNSGSLEHICDWLELTAEQFEKYVLHETSTTFPSDLTTTEWKLPERWCIKVQSGGLPMEVNEWRKTSPARRGFNSSGYLDETGWHSSVKPDNRVEITLAQFREHVLHQPDKDCIEQCAESAFGWPLLIEAPTISLEQPVKPILIPVPKI